MFTPLIDNELKLLPVFVLGSNRLEHQKPEKYPGGFAVCSQFSLFTAGSGIFIDHNNNKHRVRSGDVFYFTEDTPVEYYPMTDGWACKYIMCGGEALGRLMDCLGFSQSGVIATRSAGVYDEVNAMFENIVELNKIGGRLANSELSYLMYELLMTLGESARVPGTDPARRKLEPVVAYIRERFYEDISLDMLAAGSGYNATYLEKLFRSVYGVSPIAFLMRTRIENAQKLLCSDLSLTAREVGERCGFNDKSYFGKTFKRYTGLTPREYRAANTYFDTRGGV